MKQHQLHPAEIAPFTTEAYLPGVSVKSQWIYVSVLVAVVAALAALPFIYVEVSVQSTGIIRPTAERNELRSLVAGTISHTYIKENETVVQGQTLFRLQTDVLDTKIRLNKVQQTEKLLYINDLEKLVLLNKEDLSCESLASPLYRQQFEQFRWLLSENQQTQRKRKREMDVSKRLLEEKVAAQIEFEDKEFAYQNVQAQYQTTIERHISEWQTALSRFRMDLDELRAQERQWGKERELYTLKAPISGNVSQLAGKYTGGYLQAGELLGVISPDSNLVVECYVAPKDIGLLKKGMKTRIQMDAFDYNQWGLAEGVVSEIANDLTISDNQQPFFKVKCKLLQNHLALPNGYKGVLKKGMTLRTHFIVARRSLFDLLYDKADDWLNPKTVGSNQFTVGSKNP
ncbi:HlyD family secretion protein [Runella slithyformis]|uniref:Secretion protein HlyD family protein n=1 Tax=Runella slithyformis (strain ATCC 29530 / DSM 19594 / LMG 11500 / NCIMB 11436 / LSU 4) TaxID=761193 RepID=A0A7U3ZKF2_RUNSL|nr:HlyD family efflux transporter periplasmic adaptor subunit [Runella slithyformis]AEI48855.1 secretion protein HlyD family protein [Runella slithyformis DSM 19594]